METRPLGTGRERIPVVGFRTWKVLDVRGTEAEGRARKVVEATYGAGVRVFDSSPMYGEAERVLGAAVRPFREDVFVATKVWAQTEEEAERQIRRSLAFFGGRIELYQVHNLRLLRYLLPRLRRLRAEGTVRYVGVTHYEPRSFPELARILREEALDVVQLPLHPAARQAEDQLLPIAEERGLGVLVMQPLGTGGLLTGREGPLPAPVAALGCRTWAQLALKWTLSDPRVTAVLPATRRIDHAVENAVAGDGPWLSPELRAEVARRWGDPG